MVEILMRRTKNNPILIGSAGVGKTAVVEGLAQRMARREVPSGLRDQHLMSLNISAMVAGTKYRGEFEDRVKQLLKEVTDAKNVILFVDEVHMILGAGGAAGSLDAANLLKPALAKGDIRLIGATTWEEYSKHVAADKALYRRFQPIHVEEPTAHDSVEILMGLRERYEEFHGLSIADEALQVAVRMSIRYLSDRFLPDKAIDLMDETLAKAKVDRLMPPTKVRALRRQLEGLAHVRETLPDNAEAQDVLNVATQEAELREELLSERREWYAELERTRKVINGADVMDVLARWTGVPLGAMHPDTTKRFLGMEAILEKAVVGQDEAVTELSRSLRRAAAGLKQTNRPIGIFLFLGTPGVGKSELSAALAGVIMGSEDRLIRVDMGEMTDRSNVSKLIGSPPGYVGHDEGHHVTEQVRRNPYAVVLFESVEKAHPAVRSILLQIMEEGSLTDGSGRKVDFRNTVVILTASTGEITRTAIGFEGRTNQGEYSKSTKARIMSHIKRQFPIEFINRIDRILLFRKLEEADYREIGRRILSRFASRAEKQDISVRFAGNVLEYFVRRTLQQDDGARPLRHMLEVEVEDPLATEILHSRSESVETFEVVLEDDGIKIVKVTIDTTEGESDVTHFNC
jgi:ATP-dependent Clp protease ATP-binding subunit ClpC